MNTATGAKASRSSSVGRALTNIRRRVLAGLLFVMPFVVTAWIVYWLYSVLATYVIGPSARLVVRITEGRADVVLPEWFASYVAPVVGALAVGAVLYFLGFFARARADRILDAVLLNAPIIRSIHKAVRQAFDAFRGTSDLRRFQRAVLVPFPHPGMRVPGFVTASCRDVETGKTILCVYVPTTPVPTSGYVLLLPAEEATEGLGFGTDDPGGRLLRHHRPRRRPLSRCAAKRWRVEWNGAER
jgi:uncharacterized membrane protein